MFVTINLAHQLSASCPPSVPRSCMGAVDVGAGNEAAHFSPEGWNVPIGNRGGRASGLAQAEVGGTRGYRHIHANPPPSDSSRGNSHQPIPRSVTRQYINKRHTTGHTFIFSLLFGAVVKSPQRKGRDRERVPDLAPISPGWQALSE